MRVDSQSLPTVLRNIYQAVDHWQSWPTNETVLAGWRGYVQQASAKIDAIHIEADGEIVYLGELSPGCQACKDGTWDCIFTTIQCNLNCTFCCNPHAIPADYAGSGFGATPEIITANYRRTRIDGVSFSGGDPFMNREKLYDWIDRTRRSYPDAYYWLYTNGLLADEADFQRLASLGIAEIRFNMAASGYDHPTVLRNLEIAAQNIPNVTVEIPAIPAHRAKLLACLEKWSACGVKYLNLHELMYEPGTNAAAMRGPRQESVTPDGHITPFSPESRQLTLAVMKYVQEHHIPLSVNDCSMQSKFRQVRGRRRSLLPLTQAPYETLIDDTFLESYCAYKGEDCHFFSGDALASVRSQYPDYHFGRLVRTAPLSLDSYSQWCAFEPL